MDMTVSVMPRYNKDAPGADGGGTELAPPTVLVDSVASPLGNCFVLRTIIDRRFPLPDDTAILLAVEFCGPVGRWGMGGGFARSTPGDRESDAASPPSGETGTAVLWWVSGLGGGAGRAAGPPPLPDRRGTAGLAV